ITNSIKRLSTLDERVRQAEFNAKRSLMTGYVQLARKGGKHTHHCFRGGRPGPPASAPNSPNWSGSRLWSTWQGLSFEVVR
ncbi:MAG: hypothetical protein MK221_07055, partial [Gemmatimonadetes bacterium]|nr:hypothetical protein [Gemmatimonadota bacterium]